MLYRQGDLLIRKINNIEDKEIQKTQDTILAYGEVTGHKHQLVKESEKTKIEVYEKVKDIPLYFKIRDGKAALKHEEHNTIIFDEGIYSITHEREFDPFREEIRQVMD